MHSHAHEQTPFDTNSRFKQDFLSAFTNQHATFHYPCYLQSFTIVASQNRFTRKSCMCTCWCKNKTTHTQKQTTKQQKQHNLCLKVPSYQYKPNWTALQDVSNLVHRKKHTCIHLDTRWRCLASCCSKCFYSQVCWVGLIVSQQITGTFILKERCS